MQNAPLSKNQPSATGLSPPLGTKKNSNSNCKSCHREAPSEARAAISEVEDTGGGPESPPGEKESVGRSAGDEIGNVGGVINAFLCFPKTANLPGRAALPLPIKLPSASTLGAFALSLPRRCGNARCFLPLISATLRTLFNL